MAGLGTTKDPFGGIQRNPFATGKTLNGAGRTNNATSGALPSAGYSARDRKKKANSAAIAAILPPAKADPNANPGAALTKSATPGASSSSNPPFGSAAFRAKYGS